MTPAVEKIVVFFESLTPQSVDRFGEFYAEDAYFKDPFNEAKGLAQVKGIFRHMYVALETPRFKVTQAVVDGEQCFLTWDFYFHFKTFDSQQMQTIRGASHLKLSPDGKIQFHRDYWDAAEELYEKLPVVGALMRWLKKKANS
jgi:steroid Delta-isomerase